MKKIANMILVAVLVAMMTAPMVTARVKKPTAARGAAATTTVKITNFQFTPKTVTIAAGSTVEWVNEAGKHMIEADDGSFTSDALTAGAKFSHTFAKAGKYPYHCTFHGDKGGKEMAGTVIVK